MLAKKQAVGLILKFLRNIEVKSRDGRRERELEWQRKSDKKRENQLID